MSLTRLNIKHVRNIQDVHLEPAQGLNLVVGANASGKTSLLEAIYLLGMGRSFRSINIRHVISQGAESLLVFGSVQQDNRQVNMGVEKQKDKTRIKVDGEWVKSAAILAQHLPLQLITPDSHRLIEQGPRYRRQYIDWGVFHVEHKFHQIWSRFQRVMKQRNAGLRQGLNTRVLEGWNQELVFHVEQIDHMRKAYIKDLHDLALETIKQLTDLESLDISYQCGWKQEISYSDYLKEQLPQDREAGYTRYGPHRAELSIRISGMPAAERVSRGQQKLLASALRLAQIKHLKLRRGIDSVLLVDDLPAELDSERRTRFLEALRELNTQVFVTATEAELISNRDVWDHRKLFHVEHGQLTEVI